MPDNVRTLYNNLVKDNYDLPAFDQFVQDMRDPQKLRSLHKNLASEYSLPDFDSFASDMGVGMVGDKKKDSPTQQAPSRGRTLADAATGALKSSAGVISSTSPSSEPPPERPKPSTALTHREGREMARETLIADYRDRGGAAVIDPLKTFGNLGAAAVARQAGPDAAGAIMSAQADEIMQIAGDHEKLAEYYQKRRADLETQIEKSRRSENTPVTVAMGSNRKDTDQTTALRQQLMDLDEAVKQMAPSAVVAGLNPTNAADVREAGWRIRALKEPVKVENERRYAGKDIYEAKPDKAGSGYSPLTRFENEATGLQAFQADLEERLEALPYEEGPDTPERAQLRQSLDFVRKKRQALIHEHPEAKEMLLARVIGDEIFKDLSPMQKLGYRVTREKVREAAKRLGISEEVASKMDLNRVPSGDPLDRLAGSITSTMNNFGNVMERAVAKATGSDMDKVNVRIDKETDYVNAFFAKTQSAELFQSDIIAGNVGDTPTATANPDAGKLRLNAYTLLGAAGEVTGSIASQAALAIAGRGAGRAIGLGARAAGLGGQIFGTTASVLDQNMRTAREQFDDPATQAAFVVAQTAKTAAIEMLVPDAKYVDDIIGKTADDAVSFGQLVARKGGVENLTRASVKGWMLKSGVANTITGSLKEGGEETLEQITDYAINAMFNPASVEDRDLAREVGETFTTTAIGSLLFTGAGQTSQAYKQDRLLQEALYQTGVTPENYREAVRVQQANGDITEEQMNKNLQVINTMEAITNDIEADPDRANLSKRAKEKLAALELSARITKQKLLDAQGAGRVAEAEELQEEYNEILNEQKVVVNNPEPQTNPAGQPVMEDEDDEIIEEEEGADDIDTIPFEPAEPLAPEDIMSEEEYGALQVGDPVQIETATGKIKNDRIAEVSEDGTVTLESGLIRDSGSTDFKAEGVRMVSPRAYKTAAAAQQPPQATATEDEVQKVLEENAYRIEVAREKRSYIDDEGSTIDVTITTMRDGSKVARMDVDGTYSTETRYSGDLPNEKIYAVSSPNAVRWIDDAPVGLPVRTGISDKLVEKVRNGEIKAAPTATATPSQPPSPTLATTPTRRSVGETAGNYAIRAVNPDGTYRVADADGFEVSNATDDFLDRAAGVPPAVEAPAAPKLPATPQEGEAFVRANAAALPGVYQNLATADPQGFLRFVSQQAQGLSENGEDVNVRDAAGNVLTNPRANAVAAFGEPLVAAAISVYPAPAASAAPATNTPDNAIRQQSPGTGVLGQAPQGEQVGLPEVEGTQQQAQGEETEIGGFRVRVSQTEQGFFSPEVISGPAELDVDPARSHATAEDAMEFLRYVIDTYNDQRRREAEPTPPPGGPIPTGLPPGFRTGYDETNALAVREEEDEGDNFRPWSEIGPTKLGARATAGYVLPGNVVRNRNTGQIAVVNQTSARKGRARLVLETTEGELVVFPTAEEFDAQPWEWIGTTRGEEVLERQYGKRDKNVTHGFRANITRVGSTFEGDGFAMIGMSGSSISALEAREETINGVTVSIYHPTSEAAQIALLRRAIDLVERLTKDSDSEAARRVGRQALAEMRDHLAELEAAAPVAPPATAAAPAAAAAPAPAPATGFFDGVTFDEPTDTLVLTDNFPARAKAPIVQVQVRGRNGRFFFRSTVGLKDDPRNTGWATTEEAHAAGLYVTRQALEGTLPYGGKKAQKVYQEVSDLLQQVMLSSPAADAVIGDLMGATAAPATAPVEAPTPPPAAPAPPPAPATPPRPGTVNQNLNPADVIAMREVAAQEPQTFQKLVFSVPPNNMELDAIAAAKPRHILVSFAYWKNKDLQRDLIDRIGYRPETIMVDSGSFTFKELEAELQVLQSDRLYNEYGEDFDDDGGDPPPYDLGAAFEARVDEGSVVLQYLKYLSDNAGAFDQAIMLDVWGQPEANYNAWTTLGELGINTVPVVHLGDPDSFVDRYVQAGADFIALGGSATATPTERAAWAAPIVARYPNVKFHLLGTNNQKLIDAIPGLHSADGTAYIRAGRNRAFQQGEERTTATAEEIRRREAVTNPDVQSNLSDEERALIAEAVAKRAKFKEALRKSRGTLNSGPLPDPDVIATGVDLLATYTKLGIYKFSEMVRHMMKHLGLLDQEEIDALRGVYSYRRSNTPREQRGVYETEDQVDAFIEEELPSLLAPPPSEPDPAVTIGGKTNRFVGLNRDGQRIYEDERGIRSIEMAPGIFGTEPVSVIPGTGIGGRTRIDEKYFTPAENAERLELDKQSQPNDAAPANLPEEEAERLNSFRAELVQELRNTYQGKRERMDIRELRKIAAKHGFEGADMDTFFQEQVEFALVSIARNATRQDVPNDLKYAALVKLYNSQPTISMRSANRVRMQQYSTPLPMAFLAGTFVNHINPRRILEPSAGNGMLTMVFPPAHVHVNELDPVRVSNLSELGFAAVTNQDAMQPFKIAPVEGIVMNPPFGKSDEQEHNGYKVKGLDPNMTINALNSMADNGRAAIIIGGHNEYDDKGRLEALRTFFNYLNHHYHVRDVINMDGDLYARQGTKFPTRMILIDGRKATPGGAAPLKSDRDAVVSSWDALYERITSNLNDRPNEVLQPAMDELGAPGDSLSNHRSPTAADAPGTDALPPGQDSGADTSNAGTGRQPTRSNNGRAGGASNGGRAGGGTSANNPGQRSNDLGETGVDTNGTPNNLPGEPAAANQQGSTPAVQPNDAGRISRSDAPLDLDQEKVRYVPRSRVGTSLNTVIPTEMAAEMDRTLERIAQEVGGSIDEFVQREMGYDSPQAMARGLSAEQIDALALGIYQARKGQGLIVGDMTGVGKGRIAAGMIHWAIRQGKKPVFVSVKSDLFSDMHQELGRIGFPNYKPFVFNASISITDTDNKEVHKSPNAGTMKEAFNKGALPAGYDYAVTTYTQLQAPGVTDKKALFQALAVDNYIIMDESHKAAGVGNTSTEFQNALANVRGAMYLSATYAKTPNSMPVYAMKTAMSEAEMTQDELIAAINRGGVALQEIVSANLVESGQMIRRERDFSGVSIDYEVLENKTEEHRRTMDEITGLMRAIMDFENRYAKPAIEQLDTEAAAGGGTIGATKGAEMGISNTLFASKVFNVINQALFSLKATEVADAAIEELRNGRKPIIAFSGTMESFLEYVNAQPGDQLDNTDFALTLLRGLEGTLRYNIKDAQGKSQQAQIEVEDLSPDGQRLYAFLQQQIKKTTSGIPISPIDVIRKRIEDAGYSVKEITGRKRIVKLNPDGSGSVVARPPVELDINTTRHEFQHGNLDVILLNQSGATGISLHASADDSVSRDKRQRVMIFAQMELDVNNEIQKRGRIDRTGQIVRGAFRYIVSGIPAESRLLMMFRRKMRSLDANTTSSQRSQSSEINMPDFLNKYGDKVVAEYLAANPTMNAMLNDPLKIADDSSAEGTDAGKPGDAHKVTGRVAILPAAEQERFYADITEEYVGLIKQLDEQGENDLKVKPMPLAATTISSTIITEGKGGDSPFGANTVLEQVEANVLSKPYTAAEARAEVDRVLRDKATQYGLNPAAPDLPTLIAERETADAVRSIAAYNEVAKQRVREEYAQKRENEPARARVVNSKAKDPLPDEELEQQVNDRIAQLFEQENERLASMNVRAENQTQNVTGRLSYFKIGSTYGYPIGNEGAYVRALFLGFSVSDRGENKYRPSNVQVRFATPVGSRRNVRFPISRKDQINAIGAKTATMGSYERRGTLETWDTLASQKDRQTRYIVTGNILQAFATVKGQLVRFTTAEGDIRKGILLEEGYDPKTQRRRIPAQKAAPAIEAAAKAARATRQRGKLEPLAASADGNVKIYSNDWRGGYDIRVPKSKKQGGKYFLNQRLGNLMTQQFHTAGNEMVASFDAESLQDVLDALAAEASTYFEVQGANAETTEGRVKAPRLSPFLRDTHTERAQGTPEQAGSRADAAAAAARAAADLIPATDAIRETTIAQDFTERTIESHVGYEAPTFKDVAELFALYRSPLVEKSHLVLTKNGVIVANLSLTSNNPGETAVWEPEEVARLAQLHGADGAFLVHNHPSGDPTPSEADTELTAMWGATLPSLGVNFSGHVVLNGNRFAFISNRGEVSMNEYQRPQPALFRERYPMPTEPEAFQREAVNVADYVLKQTEGQRAIVFVDSANKIAGYAVVSPNAGAADISQAVERGLVGNGATGYMVVGDDFMPGLDAVDLPAGLLGEVALNTGVRGPENYTGLRAAPPAVGILMERRASKVLNTAMEGGSQSDLRDKTEAPFAVNVRKNSRITWAGMNKTRKSLFGVGGGLDFDLRETKEREIGNFNEIKTRARHIKADFERAVKVGYGVKKHTDLSVDQRETIDKALKGNPAAMASIPPNVQDVVTRMRDFIDSLTQKLIDGGVIPAEDDVKEQIKERTRALEALGASDEQIANDPLLLSLDNALQFAQKVKANIGTYVNRAYLKFRIKDWRNKVPEQKVQAAVNYLYREGLAQGRKLSQQQIEDIINDMLEEKGMDAIMSSGKFGLDLQILKKLKDIPAPIRDLLGEVRDADWNFMNTTVLMAQLLERHKFLNEFKDAAIHGGFLFTGRAAAERAAVAEGRSANSVVQINQPTWGPLNKMWAPREMVDQLNEWDGNNVSYNAYLKLYRDLNGLSKAAKTTLSWVSELKNLLGNVTLTAANGNFKPWEFKKGLLAVQEIFDKNSQQDNREFIAKMNRLRIVGSSLPAHEIRGAMTELTASLPDIDDATTKAEKVLKGAGNIKEKLGEVYGATDDIYKIMTWISERRALAAAYQKSGVAKTEDELDQEAAQITLRIMPTFSKVPTAIRKLSYDFPLIGTFISYPTELMRTAYNSVTQSIREIRDTNPSIRTMGYKRLINQVAVASMPSAIGVVANMLLRSLGMGADEEEREKVLSLLPEYYRNSNVVVIKTGPGKYRIWLVDGIDGHAYIRQVINAGVRGEDGHLLDAVEQALDPYVSSSLITAKGLQWIKNEDPYGRRIYNEMDEADEKVEKFVKHFGEGFLPGTFSDARKIFLGKPSTDLAVLKFLSGQTVLEIDSDKIVDYQKKGLNFDKGDISAKARSDIREEEKTKEEAAAWKREKLKELKERSTELERLRRTLR